MPDDRMREIGLNPDDRTIKLVVGLTAQILGFPRHLSQHTGGMVMTRGLLCELVPIENAYARSNCRPSADADRFEAAIAQTVERSDTLWLHSIRRIQNKTL
jgi:error-prone DNA polymerase